MIEPRVAEPLESAARAGASAGTTQGRAVVTPLPVDLPGPEAGPHPPGEGEPPAGELVAWEDGRLEGALGDAAWEAELVRMARELLARGRSRTVQLGGRWLFIEAFPPQPRLIVFGAAQIVMPLVSMARALGYETIVVDARPAFATRERFPDVDRLVVGWPDEVAESIGMGPSDAVVVLSHDVKQDEPAIVAALAEAAATSAPSGRARGRPPGGSAWSPRGLGPRISIACAALSGWTWAGANRLRPPSRSWPRS